MAAQLLLIAAACLVLPARIAGAAGELVYRGGQVAEDTTWSGKVRIRGQTVVKKGSTLTIAPGTVVAFEWSDEDGNGIGDGELKVEGRLVARGRAGSPVTFTSSRPSPSPRDWTYVMIELSRDSLVEHCLFEYAFTGLQVHFSTAVVRNSLFRRNFEALRFSTADVLIEGNDMVDNVYGIRYESRGSEATVAANRIEGNEYGFFPVVRCDSRVRIEGNCIVNGEYNVKMGQQQREDLDFRGNWWGSGDPVRIETLFFDGRREGTLGRVVYEPYLRAPPPKCGREGEE